MATVKNPLSPRSFEIPDTIADLMGSKLNCTTSGRDKNGLRWITKDDEYAVLFFEFYNKDSTKLVNLYILPSGPLPWRTTKALHNLLDMTGNQHLLKNIHSTANMKELRLKNVTWNDAESVIPHLVKWSYESQSNKRYKYFDATETRNNQPTKTQEKEFLPDQIYTQLAIDKLQHESPTIDEILYQIEKFAALEKKILKNNWREITKKNITIWFKKKN